MDDWQKTIGTREELLEALHRERERREAAKRERDEWEAQARAGIQAETKLRHEAEAKLTAVREWAEVRANRTDGGLPADADIRYGREVLALLDREGEK